MINNSLQKNKDVEVSSTQRNIELFSKFLLQESVKNRINEVIGGKNREKFISIVISAMRENKELASSDHFSILTSALNGIALNLSPTKQLGQFYLMPFKNNKTGGYDAQLVIGYKGYIQLAARTGVYQRLNVLAIKQGELKKYDPLTEYIHVELIEDDSIREKTPTVGYFAFFEYLNGFKKTLYWSKEKMEAHATAYSKSYQSDKEKGRNYSFWSKDFDGMACKTMLRQLLGKWGAMSEDLQRAYEVDMGVVKEDGNIDYVDNSGAEFEETKMIDEPKEPTKEIPTATQATKSKEDIENEFFEV